ncbi:MAG: NACHT domain-containing protein [Christensenellales bacterium]
MLTNELVDGLNKRSEILFELKTALENSLTIIPVAISSFAWNRKRVNKVIKLLSEDKAHYISKIDYIPFFGEREYEQITAPGLLKKMGITPIAQELQSIDDVRKRIIKAQNHKLFVDDNDSIIGNELLYFQQNLYIEPKKKINGNLVSEPITWETFDSRSNCMTTWFLLGEIGSGKTTLIRKLYLSFAEKSDYNVIPIFLRANEVKSLCFDKKELLQKHLLSLDIYISDTMSEQLIRDAKLCFFIDAIDEIISSDYSQISIALNQRSKDSMYVISCRKNIFQHLQINDVDYIVELLGLSNQQKGQVVDNFFALEDIANEMFKAKVKEAVVNNEIFNNILLTATWLLFLKNQSPTNFYLPINRFDMIDKILNWLIYREKKNLSCSAEEFFRIMCYIAFIFLKNKGTGRRIQFNELQYELLKNYDISISRAQIRVLLLIDPVMNECTFAHEQFYDFLIAKYFIELLSTERAEIINLVSYSFSIETNQLITEQFLKSDNKEKYFVLLKNLYDKVPADNYRAKLHILNHMHRTTLYEEIKAFVSEQLADEKNSADAITTILLMHSLMVAGDENDEEMYFNRLQSDSMFAQLNAGVTLSYYYETNIKDNFPCLDDGSKSWYPVFVGYRNHIAKCATVPHYRKVLRINFFTARMYIDTRKQVDGIVADYYLSLNDSLKQDASLFGQKVYREYLRLCSVIDKYTIGNAI